MFFYLAIGVVLWALSLPNVILKKSSEFSGFLLLLFSAFVFWSVCSFRFETGFDWLIYEQYFDAVRSSEFMALPADIVPMEPLYYLLNFIISKFGSFQFLLFVVGTFNTYCAAKFFSKMGIHGSFGFAFCFCWVFLPLQMGTIRQSIAVSMVLLSMCYAVGRENKKSLVLFVAALGFQYSALLYVLVFFERVIKFLVAKIWWFVSICLAFYLVGVGLGQLTLSVGSAIQIPFLSEKLALYSNFGFTKRTFLGGGFLVFNCAILIAAKVYIKEIGRQESIVIGALICLVGGQAFFFDFALVWNRIQYLACFSQAVILYWVMMELTEARRMAVIVMVVPLSMAALFFFVSSPAATTFIPYQSYIEHAITGEAGDGRDRTYQYYIRFNEQAQQRL